MGPPVSPRRPEDRLVNLHGPERAGAKPLGEGASGRGQSARGLASYRLNLTLYDAIHGRS